MIDVLNEFKNVDLLYFMLYLNCGVSVVFYENAKSYIKNYNTKLTNLLFLEGNYYSNKYFTIDKWYLTHLLFYGLMGSLYPDTLFISMSMGVLWESLEFYVAYAKPKWFFNSYIANEKTAGFWFGRVSDIFVNYIGFTAGSGLRMMATRYM